MYQVTLIDKGKEVVIHHPHFGFPKVLEGEIKQGINVADSFRFTILPDNPGYDLIRPFQTLVQVLNLKTNKLEFDGRILMPTETMSEEGAYAKTFLCESELGYLNDSCQRHGEYHDISVRDFLQIIIENHNNDIAHDEVDKTFRVGIVEVDTSTGTLYRYLGYEQTLETIDDKLLSRLGGELRVRKENGVRYLDYLWEVGETKSTEIRIAKNLKSITKEVDPEDVVTRLVPLGTTIESENEEATDASPARLTIEEVNNGKDYIEDEEAQAIFGVITKSQVWDDITIPSNLLSAGRRFLRENNKVKIKYQLSALDLFLIGLDTEQFEVGSYYPVVNPVMGIDEPLRVVEKTIDIIDPNANDLSVGDLFKTASQYQHEVQKHERTIVDLQSVINRQAQRIGSLQDELTAVDDAVQSIEDALAEADLPALEQAIQDLQDAIDALNDAIDNIPIYEPATPTQDGLMSASDKAKLDRITILNNIDLDALKSKLDLITVINTVDLDDLVSRVETLEDEVFG